MLLLWLACAPEPADPDAVTALWVEPAELQVVTGPGGVDPIAFTATGDTEREQGIPLDTVSWSLSNQSAGEIDELGNFTPSTLNGGVTWVLAKLDGVEGLATVTVQYQEEVILDPEIDTSTLLAGENTTNIQDFWLYPEDGVSLPRNTPAIRFNWSNLGAVAYRLRLQSPVTDVSVYTRELSWTADSESWQNIAATNAGGQVQVDLYAELADGNVVRTESRTVQVNRMGGRGSILYWSTAVGGVLEVPFGQLNPSDYLSTTSTGRCVGCHVVSSKGDIAFTWDGGNGGLGVKDAQTLEDRAGSESVAANFKTWSPDGERLMATFGGALMLLDARGVLLHEVPMEQSVTHPAWSPDGEFVALVLTPGHEYDWHFEGTGELATIRHMGDGIFDNPKVIFTPPAGYKAYYPSYSPDGDWIAFNVSTGDAYDDPDAELWVIDAKGKHDAIRLDAANLVGELTNSWSKWGPLPDDDILWLTFSSKRAYGDVSVNIPQVWVSAFDPELAFEGKDPSKPAFWLPGQDPTQGNHIPEWVQW